MQHIFKQILTTSIVLLFFTATAKGQTYTLQSKVIDNVETPIANVACVLHSLTDNLYSQSVISDADGLFKYDDLSSGKYILYFTHVSYNNHEVYITIEDKDLILNQPYILKYKDNMLDEFVVSAERPLVRVVDNKFIYNTSVIQENKVVSNAFDLLRHIPNMTGVGDNLRLVGTKEYTILIDGKPSTLSSEEIVQTLKSMPASRVADIEIMYSTPPQYNVRGAAVNIVTKRDTQTSVPTLKGEVATEYQQAYYPGYGIRSNILYSLSSFKADLNIGFRKTKEWNRNTIDATHQIEDNKYIINQDDEKIYNLSATDIRLNMSQEFKDNGTLSFTYTTSLANRKGGNTASTDFIQNNTLYSEVVSVTNKKISTNLHNVRMDYYSSKNISAGIDYTSYNDPTKEVYKDSDVLQSMKPNEYRTTSRQDINKVLAYVNNSTSLFDGWNVNYGVRGNYSTNTNNYDYFGSLSQPMPDSISNTKQQEYNYSAYVSFSKDINDKLSLQASFSGGIYHGTIETNGVRKTLWNKFEPFVNANISYLHSENHIWQLAFSSNVEYPPYWALSNSNFRLNAYSVLMGNPSLKFARKYNTQIVYVINNKYTIVGYNNYTPDYISQLPYQSTETLQNKFQMVNLDYQNTYGIVAIAPFKVGRIINSELTLNLFRQVEKDSDFNDLSYKNSHNSFTVQLDNSFNISSKPIIKAELSAFYLSGAIQGIYNIRDFYSITAGIKWQSNDNRMELGAHMQDVFNSSSVILKTNYQNQNLRMHDFADTPLFRLSFSYRFGNYSKNKQREFDKSRFDR